MSSPMFSSLPSDTQPWKPQSNGNLNRFGFENVNNSNCNLFYRGVRKMGESPEPIVIDFTMLNYYI